MTQVDPVDLVSALSVYKASAAGAMDTDLAAGAAGVLGAALVDTGKITASLVSGELEAESAIREYEKTIWAAVESGVTVLAKKGVDVAATIAKAYFPTFTGAIQAVATIVTDSLIPKISKRITTVAKRVWDWIVS